MSGIEIPDVKSLTSHYVDRVDSHLKLSQNEYEVDGAVASKDDVYEAADFLMGFYDQILGVDSSDSREEFKDNIIYDTDFMDHFVPSLDVATASMYAVGLGTGGALAVGGLSQPSYNLIFGLAAAQYFQTSLSKERSDGSFDRFSKDIGISNDEVPRKQAFDILSAELYHAFQVEFDSPTWREGRIKEFCTDTQKKREGTERAVRVKSLQEFAEQNFFGENWENLYNQKKATTLVRGYLQQLSHDKSVDERDVLDVGVPEDLVDEALETIDSTESVNYDSTAAAIMTFEEVNSERIYEEVFHGRTDPLEII